MKKPPAPPCDHHAAEHPPSREYALSQLEVAAAMCHALSDPARLRLLLRLAEGERCVSELVDLEQAKLSSVSARLGALHAARLVSRRRDAKHVFYALADDHVRDLLASILNHAAEASAHPSPTWSPAMTNCTQTHHTDHAHQHGPGCNHTAIRHDGHVDYLHDGHLHHPHGDHVDEHVLAVSAANPERCTPQHTCAGHAAGHIHGPGCGHEAVPHGDHVDYLVDGHLHHPHAGHCDDHGAVALA